MSELTVRDITNLGKDGSLVMEDRSEDGGVGKNLKIFLKSESKSVPFFSNQVYLTVIYRKRQFNYVPQTQPGRFNYMPQPQQPRFPQPQPGDRGSIGVTVNKDQGRGPQIRTEAQGRIYTSQNGNWRVDGNGYHEAGRGRKPDYGVGVKVEGRFRREVEDERSADEQIEENVEFSGRE